MFSSEKAPNQLLNLVIYNYEMVSTTLHHAIAFRCEELDISFEDILMVDKSTFVKAPEETKKEKEKNKQDVST